jgi:hypothetical protein
MRIALPIWLGRVSPAVNEAPVAVLPGVHVPGNIGGKADRVLGMSMAGRLDGPRSARRAARPTALPCRGRVPDAPGGKRGVS